MPESALNIPRGFADVPWGVVEISGADAADFLNRMSTLDFKRWDATQTRLGAFLTGKSGLLTLGYFQSAPEGFHYCVPHEQVPTVLEHLEKFHFAEKLEYRNVSERFRLSVWNGQPPPPGAKQWNDAWVSGLVWCKFPVESAPIGGSLSAGMLAYAWERTGMPRLGRDVSATTMILEANLERAVDRNKGCYPGQEVVERIFTYGQVNRKLLPVAVSGDWRDLELPMKFERDAKIAAVLQSVVEDPENPSLAVGLAFLYRSQWGVAEPLSARGVEIRILS